MTDQQKENNRKMLHELLDIVLDVNGLESRSRDKTGTLPTVFVDFSGHVSLIQIRLYTDGWSANGHEKDWSFYFNEPINHEVIDAIRNYGKYALTDKKESEVIQRSIDAQADVIQDEKGKLKELKKSLRKAQKREERQAVTV